jgi:anti-sigma regulatory factor (Ser/Thr protein kinase)
MTTVSARRASSSGAEGLPSVRCSFAETPSSPREARAFVRSALRSWGLDGVEDVLLLLVSELTTNVVLHARTSFDVTLDQLADAVRLTVLDDSASGPVRRRSGLRSATGRGLALVETLADDWGRTDDRALHGRAKGIWCDVPLEAGAEALDEGAIYGTDWLAQLDGPLER